MIIWIWVINTATSTVLQELSKEGLAVHFRKRIQFSLQKFSAILFLSSVPRHSEVSDTINKFKTLTVVVLKVFAETDKLF